MTDKFRLTLVWLAGAVGALIVAIAPLSSSMVKGGYVPIGQDGFYHARRILDAAGPVGFYEFDRFMHVPEGSLIPWPWAYDYVMSLIVRAAHAIFGVEPMTALAQIPVLSFPIAIALIVLLSRRVGLGTGTTLIAAVFTAFFPLNQTLYAVGAVDHHFAEHLFVLGGLLAGLSWLANPDSRRLAITAGIVLGIAPSFQNGLFILQLPLLITLLIWWLRSVRLPATTLAFSASLLVSTLLVAIPSASFRELRFEFYTLSWFHVYASAASAIAAFVLSRVSFSIRNLLVFGVAALAVAAPLATQALIATKFLSASVEGMGGISEAQSLRQMYKNGGWTFITLHYSMAIYLVPATVLLVAWRLWRDREPAMWLFWIASLFGIGLLTTQMRLHYFGSFALYLPWLVVIQRWVSTQSATKTRLALVATAAAAAVGCTPAVQHKLFMQGAVSGDPVYDVTRPIFPSFTQACKEDPGVALAWPDDGHYIRFHTACSVIANPFLLTPLHEAKIRRVNELMKLSAQQLIEQAPDIGYVYARKGTMFYLNERTEAVLAPYDNPMDPEPRLIEELLKAPRDHLPPGYTLIQQLAFDQEGKMPVARLLKIERPAVASSK